MLKKDNLRLGLFLGFLAPLLGLTIYYFKNFYPTYSLKDFLEVLDTQTTLITGVVMLSLFVNAAMLTYYLNTKKDKTAIGIFIAACIYGIASLLIKWFL